MHLDFQIKNCGWLFRKYVTHFNEILTSFLWQQLWKFAVKKLIVLWLTYCKFLHKCILACTYLFVVWLFFLNEFFKFTKIGRIFFLPVFGWSLPSISHIVIVVILRAKTSTQCSIRGGLHFLPRSTKGMALKCSREVQLDKLWWMRMILFTGLLSLLYKQTICFKRCRQNGKIASQITA